MQKPKRFYKDVAVRREEGGFSVLLDGKPIRTPGERALVLARQELADSLAEEWRRQDEFIKLADMPLMRFATFAIDAIEPDPAAARDEIVKYARSDLLCYRAGYPNDLIERQRRLWDPALQRLQSEHGIAFRLSTGIVYAEQDAEEMAKIEALVAALTGLTLAATHAVTTLTGSAVLALALGEGWITSEEAWKASHVDEDYQIELWGADSEAEARRSYLLRDFTAAVQAL